MTEAELNFVFLEGELDRMFPKGDNSRGKALALLGLAKLWAEKEKKRRDKNELV